MKKLLKDDAGSAMPLFIILIFFVLSLVAVFYQNDTMITTGRSVQAAMQKVVLNTITQNSEETYPSKREGYTGAYEKQAEWKPAVENINPVEQLQFMLHLTPAGDALVKYDNNGTELYRLTDIQLLVENTDFLDTSKGIKSTMKLNLIIPINYPLIGERPITILIRASAENKMKF